MSSLRAVTEQTLGDHRDVKIATDSHRAAGYRHILQGVAKKLHE